jgi:hypothetical protein
LVETRNSGWVVVKFFDSGRLAIMREIRPEGIVSGVVR